MKLLWEYVKSLYSGQPSPSAQASIFSSNAEFARNKVGGQSGLSTLHAQWLMSDESPQAEVGDGPGVVVPDSDQSARG